MSYGCGSSLMFLCSLAVPHRCVDHEIWEPSLDFSIFVMLPDCPMNTPMAFRERGLKEDLVLNLGVSAFSGVSQFIRRVGVHWTVGWIFMDLYIFLT